MLSYFTSMTCLYDPFWVPEIERATLPICTFHVTGIQESSMTTVQKKRVLLYEPQVTDTTKIQGDMMRDSVLRTVVDNAVRDPRTYTINAILPYQPLGRYVAEGSLLFDTIAVFLSELASGDSGLTKALANIGAASSVVARAYDVAADSASKLPFMQDVSRINKDSLDAMQERSHLLCMKMWTGYDYKYVMITSMNIDKRPHEDDVYRLVLNVQEMPVMSIGSTSYGKLGDPYKLSMRNAAAVAQRWLSKPLINLMMGKKHSKSIWEA